MKKILSIIGPGLLVAATGVGAGDLATSALAGSHIGFTAMVAIVFGGVIKYFLNEGIARWQFRTSTTLLDGALSHFGRAISLLFLIYLICWSFTVAVALMSASGAALHAIIPFIDDSSLAKIIYGALLSVLGYALVRIGGFKLFQHLMTGAVAIMLLAVFYSVFQLDIDMSRMSFHLVPRGSELSWYLAVMGGVGGTVTVLCYGYWIRVAKRSEEDLSQTKIDLGVSYLITVLLGLSMVVIGSGIEVSGGGAGLLVNLAESLDAQAGATTGWLFRIGAFAAIFSSLMGVWQSVPYLFIDTLKSTRNTGIAENKVYNRYLFFIAFVPMIGLPLGFASMQKVYVITGAAFVPMLAAALLLLEHRQSSFKNSQMVRLGLWVILLFFLALFALIFW